MSYAAHRKDFGPVLDATPPEPSSASIADTPGLFARLLDRILEPRHAQVDREIGALLARSGGRLTDSLEREMMQHLMRSGVGLWR